MSQPSWAFSFKQTVLLLGKASEPLSALNLDILPTEPRYIDWQQRQLPAAFLLPVIAAESVTERIIKLLERLVKQMAEALHNQVVYLILPEFNGPDNQQLTALLQHIMRLFPQLLQSEDCRLFPYGSAGALMALSTAREQLQQNSSLSIWLVSVDTLADAGVLQQYASGIIQGEPSEAAIALQLVSDINGISLTELATDASVASTQEHEPAIAALFRQLASKLKQPINAVYLPDCGDFAATERWLSHYQYLHGVVDQQTTHILPSYATGELGACGGLYRLLHLWRGYQSEMLQGLTVQCEFSSQLYRATAVFSSPAALLKHKEA